MANRLGRIFGKAHRFAAKAVRSLSLLPTMAVVGAVMVWDRFSSLVDQGYRRNSVAYACIRALSTAVAEPRLVVTRDGEVVDGHPLLELLERPNPHMTQFEFWELIVTHMAICGRSFWWKQRSNRGAVAALWPLRPDRMSPRFDGGELLAGWSYTIDGRSFFLPVEDVLAFNLPDPGDETGGVVGGLGPLQVLAAEIDTDNEATGHVFSLLRNYAVPGVAVKVRGEVDQEEADDFKRQFVARYGGSRRGEPAVIDGDAEIVPLSHSLRDLEFPDLRGVAESRICAAFGVPPILVGVKVGLDRSTFSNAAESRRFWTQTRLAEWWRRLSDQVAMSLLPDFGSAAGLRCAFRVEELPAHQEIMAEQAERHAAAFKAGALLVDEYRAALGLDPLPGGAGQRLYRPVAVVVTDGAGEAIDEAPRATEDDDEDDEATEDDDEDEDATADASKAAKPPAVKVQEAERRRLAAAAHRDLAAAWAKIGDRVARRVEATKGGLPGVTVKAEFFTTADEAEIAGVILAHSTNAADAGYARAVELLGEVDLAPFPSAAVRQRVADEVGRRIVGINATTRADVARVVLAGLDSGQTLSELAASLRGLFVETYRGRAMAVARTEMAHHYNLGSLYAYRESMMVEAVNVFDGDRDAGCNAANGTTQSLAWAEANPIEHPNCQRVFAPVLVPLSQVAA